LARLTLVPLWCAFDGGVQVSTGQRVTEWTARQAIDVNEAKPTIANDEQFLMAA